MSRPPARRTENREAVDGEIVKSWFGKKGAQKLSPATIDRLTEAAAKLAGPDDRLAKLRHERFLATGNDLKRSQKATKRAGESIRMLMCQNVTDEFRDFLAKINRQAEALYDTANEFTDKVERELNFNPDALDALFLPAHGEWVSVVRELLPIIADAVSEAGFSSAATSKKTRMVTVLRCFLKSAGWRITDSALEQFLSKHTQ